MSSLQKFVFFTKSLEVADGKDGFLRGGPDPTIVLAVYAVHGVEVLCMGRSIWRFKPDGDMPCIIRPIEGEAITKQVNSEEGVNYVVVSASVEENNGDGVRNIYGALENHGALSIWQLDEYNPSPVQLPEMSGEAGNWRTPQRVGLLRDGNDLAKSFESDTWVGAVAWRIPGGQTGVIEYRLPFGHYDADNNWTAIAEAYLS